VRLAPGSDNWQITWADNGHQYTCWGDGGGFGGTNSDGRVSLGIARVEGSAENYTGYNIWGGKNAENPASFGGKSYGITAVKGNLYMWVSPGSGNKNYQEARLAKSTDYGASWIKADWVFSQDDLFILPTFCQFGKDYEGARDNYVYIYATRLKNASELMQKPGEINLMRVPKDKIMEKSAYKYFAGLDGKGHPLWTDDSTKICPVFKDLKGCKLVSVSYNEGLGRYLLCTEHVESHKGNLGIFDAPEPWGLWTTVVYYSNWGGFGSTFFWNFSNKWLSEDGRHFTMIFTGTGENDAWNTVNGTFSIFQTKNSSE